MLFRSVRQRRNPSPLLAAIRGISYAEAAASVLTLQRSMLVSFGAMSAGNIHLMNALTGAGVQAVWNFAPVRLRAPERVLVQQEDMASSLALLSHHLKNLCETPDGVPDTAATAAKR